jgi:hypothetical protein
VLFIEGPVQNDTAFQTNRNYTQYLTMMKQVSIILQIPNFIRPFFFIKYKEELMKPANSHLLKELKTNKMLQRKLGSTEFKLKLKDQMTNRQRIGLSVTAGHVRGGHSFH